MPETRVEVAFELTVGDTPYFRLDDPVKGVLDNPDYRLAGPIWIDITSKVAAVNIKRGKNRELERYNASPIVIFKFSKVACKVREPLATPSAVRA